MNRLSSPLTAHRRRALVATAIGVASAPVGFALLIAGCGGGDGERPFVAAPSPFPTPSPSGAVVTAPDRPEDFAFVGGFTPLDAPNPAIGDDNVGTYTLRLRSVNGFKSPITFPTTVEKAGDGTDLSSVVRVTTVPATLTNIPAGTAGASVVLRIQTTRPFPPASTFSITVRAEGGGLVRYVNPSETGNGGGIKFGVPGIGWSSANKLEPINLNTTSRSSQSSLGFSNYVGGGRVTFAATGLPPGVTATFPQNVNVTGFPTNGSPSFYNSSVTLTASAAAQPGTYPVRFVGTVNGKASTSQPYNLVLLNSRARPQAVRR